MSRIHIKTLTPVHVGSGLELQGNIEYLWFTDREQAVVLEDGKVLDIIGADFVAQWISCIEQQEPLLTLLQQRKPGLKPEDVARRTIRHGRGRIDARKGLREQLHNSNSDALLPGSSLKGAIRTAVWSKLIFDRPELVQDAANLGLQRYNRKTDRDEIAYDDGRLGDQLFGKDPNHDIFRLLLPGDVHFDCGTAVYRTEVVNLRHNDEYDLKDGIAVQIEAVPAGAEAVSEWRFNQALEKLAVKYNVFNANAALMQPDRLFPTVNAHTIRLLENEIKFWRDQAALPAVLGTYVEDLENVLETARACTGKSCVLRLGWGTGFRSMTGDWHINLSDDDYYDLIASLRPTHPENIQYPKTTRLIAGGTPLGFLTLRMQ